MNKRLIIHRDSPHELTFAIIEYAGCEERDLLETLKAALRKWKDTPDGAFIYEHSNDDFNVGDLANNSPLHSCQNNDLSRLLKAQGISYLSIDCFSQDGRHPEWVFDTRLM